MDTEEQDHVLRYLSYLHAELQLGPWQIILSPEHTPDGEDDDKAMASVDIADGRWVALVRLSKNWGDYRDEERKDSLLHEMVHLLTHDLFRTSRMWTIQHVAKNADAGVALVELDRQEELLADRLTVLLGRGLLTYGTAPSVAIPNVRAQDGWC